MDSAVGLEVVKLLLQVAWSDLELSSKEIAVLLEVAQKWGVPEKEAFELVGAIADRRALPAPNLGLLRQHRDRALELVDEMAKADGIVVPHEEEMMAEIDGLLSGGD